MTLSNQVKAIRQSVALSLSSHVRCIRFTGDGAFEAADRLFTRDLYVRDGQLSHGLLLHEDGTVFADCYLGSDDEDFFLLLEGPEEGVLREYLEHGLQGIQDLHVVDQNDADAIIAVDGPYAWELMSLLVGPEVIGLPYLTFFRFDDILCYRAGKTGEYGYRLIVRRAEQESTWDRLREVGRELDLSEASLTALDQCALDNWFFNVRREGRRPVTPIELQLQWRVSYRKSYVGSRALARRRAEGARHRLTCLVSRHRIDLDDQVSYGGEHIGEVVNAAYSPIREQWVAVALVDAAYAYPWVAPLAIGHRAVPGGTVSPPVNNNRSLYVNPQIHSYATRFHDDFPPI